MKRINNYLYKIANVKHGRQTIKFHKEGVIDDREQEGTSILELLKVIEDKLKTDSLIETKEKEELNVYINKIQKLL